MTDRRAVTPWAGLAAAISVDRAIIGPAGARLLLTLVGHAERLARRDGIGLSPQLTHVRDVLQAVAMSPPRHDDVADKADPPEWESTSELGTDSAAALLGLSRRQVQRIASDMGARRAPGGGYLFNPAEVHAYRVHRQGRHTA